MKITVDQMHFDTIQSFTDYLEHTYGQTQVSSTEVLIRLKCEALEAEHVDQLVNFLLNPEHFNVYKFQITSLKNKLEQQAFDDAYLISKRRQRAVDFQQQMVELMQEPVHCEPFKLSLRKSKKSWVQGTQGAPASMQIPSRQHKPLLIANLLTSQATLRAQQQAREITVPPPNPLVTAASLGELIDRATIHVKLKRFSNKLYKDKAPDLLNLWDRLVGVHADKIQVADRKITHVQHAAIEQIIRYYPEFAYGVVFDNLPPGFYLQKTEEGYHVLCYTNEIQQAHLDAVTPFTIIPEGYDPVVCGSSNQFFLLEHEVSNPLHYQREFTHLFDAKVSLGVRQRALRFFLHEMERDQLKQERIQSLLNFLPLTELDYQGLGYALVNSGADGVLLLLQRFKALYEKEIFHDFQHLFLDTPASYAKLVTPEGIENLETLSELTSEQYAWWHSLVSQHKAAGARTNFNELFDAYYYFLTKLGENAQHLPAGCPLENIRHMKPALERALFIITNAADPQEQLMHLNELDYDMDGAYYASRYLDYKLVSCQMGLTRAGSADETPLKNINELFTFFTTQPVTNEERIKQFYRFIGTQDWAYTLDVYQRLEAKISEHASNLDNQTKYALLCMMLLATTGPNIRMHSHDPCRIALNLLDKMIAAVPLITPGADLKTGLMLISAMCMGTLSANPLENRLSLNDLHQLVDALCLNHHATRVIPEAEMSEYFALALTNNLSAGNQTLKTIVNALGTVHDSVQEDAILQSASPTNVLLFMLLSFSLFQEYGHPGVAFINNYKKRLLVEQSGSSTIHSFNVNLLLSHLHPAAKLGTHLAESFREQPATKAQFMVLMSLISDEISAYQGGDPGVSDSAFETCVKELVQALLTLQEERRALLLAVLSDIRVDASHQLPSLRQLIEVVQLVQSAEPELDAIADSEQQKSRILVLLGSNLPHTQIGTVAKPSLVKPENQMDYETNIQEAIASLNTDDQAFDEYLTGMIPDVYFDEFDDEFYEERESEFSQQYDEIQILINALIFIKNNHLGDFHQCIHLLSEEVTSEKPRDALSLSQIGTLMAALCLASQDTVAEPLAVLLSSLEVLPDYSEVQLDNALDQVATLSRYRHMGALDAHAYMFLLRVSFQYNLSHAHLFPIDELMRFYDAADVDKKTSTALFNAWMNLLKRIEVQDVDAVLLRKVIINTAAFLQTFDNTEIKSPLLVLTLLINACRTASAAELAQYDALLTDFSVMEQPVLDVWLKIFIALGDTIPEDKLPLLFKLQEGLEIQKFNLKDIASLFESPPYPDLEHFIDVLHGSAKVLRDYVSRYDKDPKNGRAAQYDALFGINVIKTAEQVVQEQFDMTSVIPVIAEIKDILERGHLTSQEQYELAEQVTYINAIGKDYPLVIKGISEEESTVAVTYHDLTLVSRAQLRQISDYLITVIRRPDICAADKLKAQLNLLAIVREHYERATGQIIYAPQLVAALLSLKQPSHNLLLEIDSDQDTTISNVLIAVMQWIEADGGSVDLCCQNRAQLQHEYFTRGHRDFFASLGIESSCIDADSSDRTYRIGGINCSTIGDLALYRQRAKQENVSLIAERPGHSLSSNLIVCGGELTAFNPTQLFELTRDHKGENPYAWIYPLVNEFINQEQFKRLNHTDGWSARQDLAQLKGFLEQQAPAGFYKTLLNEVSNEQLDLWINSAIVAQRLVEGEDFDIVTHSATIHRAIPCLLKKPQTGASIAQDVQYFLHARLEKEYASNGWKFPIDPQKTVVVETCAKDLIDDYKTQGRIIGLSKRLELDRLDELHDAWNLGVICKMPPCQTGCQQEQMVSSAQHTECYFRLIHDAINSADNNQPIVLIVQDEQEMRQLEARLRADFGTSLHIGTLDHTNKYEWLKKEAGHQNTITITTASMLEKGAYFNTPLPEGFFTIQTYPDSASNVSQFLRRISRYEKPGKYMMCYEVQGKIESMSWSYYDTAERELMFQGISALQKKCKEITELEHYYKQRVAAMHYVVLKQFDEWQAFLRSVFPRSELIRLNQDLLVYKDGLSQILSETWQTCLNQFELPENYSSLYEQRVGKGQNLLDIRFQAAFDAFEQATIEIWKTTCSDLQEKTAGTIEPDSVQEMHCTYLTNLSIEEELRVHQLAEYKNKEKRHKEKEKTLRSLTTALDVNGAMLRYYDGDRDSYRDAFIKNQVKLLQNDVARIIENETSLSYSVRKELYDQVRYATSLNALILFLNSYVKWFPDTYFEKKYAMQPVIQQVLAITQQAGLAEAEHLLQLKELYINNVVDELVDELETTLSWAKEDNRGLGYLLERAAVANAARDVLHATAMVREAANASVRQVAIRNLYKVLTYHQFQLDGLWIFSLGHKNTRTLIQQTLATLDGLTLIGNDEDILDSTFIRDCKEQAVHHVMRQKFNSAFYKLEQTDEKLLNERNPAWRQIKGTLREIENSCNSAYVFYEMNYFIVNKIAELRKTNPELVAPLSQVYNEISKIWDEYHHNHPELMDESKYFKQKAAIIESELSFMDAGSVTGVTLKPAHNGVNDYLDLIVTGHCSNPVFEEFEQYNSQAPKLRKKQAEITERLEVANRLLLQLEQVKASQLSLLTYEAHENAEPILFPVFLRERVKTILQLKAYALSENPGDLSGFSETVRNHFHDRIIMKKFTVENLTLDELNKLRDPDIKEELTVLHQKIKASTTTRSFLGNAWFLVTSTFVPQETEENWHQQLKELQKQSEEKIDAFLRPQIEQQRVQLTALIDNLFQKTHEQISKLQSKEELLTQQIAKEEAKSGVYRKRFGSVTEFYKFEAQLKQARQTQEEMHCLMERDEEMFSDEFFSDEFFSEYHFSDDEVESPTAVF